MNKGQEWLHTSIHKNIKENEPLIHFINDEKQFCLTLIQEIHKSLSAINRIIRGTILPTKSDLQVASSLSSFHVSIAHVLHQYT